MARRGPPVRRAGPDRLDLRLDAEERRILRSLVGELRAELDDPAAAAPDGTLARLYPPAFPDDPGQEAAWEGLVRDSLADGRRQRLATMAATLDADQLDDAQAAAWLGSLNDLRLVLGTSLGVTEEDEGRPLDPADPDAMRRAVFGYLGWLVGELTDVLAAALPDLPLEAD